MIIEFHPDASDEAEAAENWYAERSLLATRSFVSERFFSMLSETIPIELIGLPSRSAYQLNGADPAPFGRGFASLGRVARIIACAISTPNQRRRIVQPVR
jgi:hypothetical protein